MFRGLVHLLFRGLVHLLFRRLVRLLPRLLLLFRRLRTSSYIFQLLSEEVEEGLFVPWSGVLNHKPSLVVVLERGVSFHTLLPAHICNDKFG